MIYLLFQRKAIFDLGVPYKFVCHVNKQFYYSFQFYPGSLTILHVHTKTS